MNREVPLNRPGSHPKTRSRRPRALQTTCLPLAPRAVALLLTLVLIALGTPARAQSAADTARKAAEDKQRLQERYLELASEIQPRRLDAHLTALTQYESRVCGYWGERQA